MDQTSENIETLPLSQYTSDAYLDYSMYVINDRALPHVADGLKPVPVSYTHLTLPTKA